jgi:hypothetical protein
MESHIYQLLHRHECVVIPDLGAFVLRYYPAELQEGTFMFRPPSRRVCFQPDLKMSDGILAHHIARKESVSYREALKRIDERVAEWKKKLRSGHSIALAGIGKIYQLPGNILEFFPELDSNFLRNSYGFQIIRLSEKEKTTRNIEVPSFASAAQPPAQEAAIFTPWLRRVTRVAAIVLPAALAFNMLSTSRTALEGQYEAGLTPFEKTMTVSDRQTFARDMAEKAKVIEIFEEEKPAAEKVTEEIAEPIVVEDNIVPAKPMSLEVKIIVGAFGDINNAQRYIKDLQAKGFDAQIAGKSGNLTRVSAGEFATEQEARVALAKIRESLNQNAWIYTP